ncbi:MAG: ABC transporter permease [Clostridiales bacterium]|nr:ABC transporter permease [Clostridiales bacterium]
MLIFMYAPIVVLIAFSFNASRSRGQWGGFTLDWYVKMMADTKIMKALYNTVLIAVLSSFFATVIGTFAAIGINNFKKLTRTVVMNITNLPVLNPDIVTGVSLMILYIFIFRVLNFGQLGFATLLISHITFNIPYVILSVLPKLKQLNPNLYEAALDLGASPMYGFFKVILPEIMPGIVTGFIMALTLSIDDFVISFFTTGSGVSTLSVTVYAMARRGVDPKINALSTIMFIVVLVLLYTINKRDSKQLQE